MDLFVLPRLLTHAVDDVDVDDDDHHQKDGEDDDDEDEGAAGEQRRVDKLQLIGRVWKEELAKVLNVDKAGSSVLAAGHLNRRLQGRAQLAKQIGRVKGL